MTALGFITHTMQTGHAGPIVGFVVIGLVAVFGVGFLAVRLLRGRGRAR
jgi:hypothetical protein